MPSRHCRSFIHVFVFIVFILICGLTGSIALGQGAKQKLPDTSIPDADADHVQPRSEWFFRGRLVPGKPAAELRRRAYQAKLQMRAQRAAAMPAMRPNGAAAPAPSGGWTPLGPAPLASDATGNGRRITIRSLDAPPPLPSIPPTRPAIPSTSAAPKVEFQIVKALLDAASEGVAAVGDAGVGDRVPGRAGVQALPDPLVDSVAVRIKGDVPTQQQSR